MPCTRMRPLFTSVRVVALSAMLGLGASIPATAQDIVAGNLFAGAGAYACCGGGTGAFELGLGADLPLRGNASFLGEFGVNGPSGAGEIREPFATHSFGALFFIGLNGAYHFAPLKQRRVRPFATGGIDVDFRGHEATGGFNFGAGVDWSVGERRGVRIEARDQILGESGGTHLLTVRVGFLFR